MDCLTATRLQKNIFESNLRQRGYSFFLLFGHIVLYMKAVYVCIRLNKGYNYNLKTQLPFFLMKFEVYGFHK